MGEGSRLPVALVALTAGETGAETKRLSPGLRPMTGEQLNEALPSENAVSPSGRYFFLVFQSEDSEGYGNTELPAYAVFIP